MDALRWLKANNPKYYGEINISEEQANLLPEDDVPEELLAIIRQSTDRGLVDQEADGYVPHEDGGMRMIVKVCDEPY
jgi:hypothetical protein